MGKDWRITDEQQFYLKALKHIDNHVESFMKRLYFCTTDLKKIRSIRSRYNAYKDISDKFIKEKIRAGLWIVLEDLDNWKSFSSGPHTDLNEIMLRTIISNTYQCNYVCLLYVSMNIDLTEEFIEDLIYVSSPLFKFNEWDDKHVEAVTNCAASGINANKSKELIELYGKKRLTNRPIDIKIDLSEVGCGRMSEKFRSKYYYSINKTKRKN